MSKIRYGILMSLVSGLAVWVFCERRFESKSITLSLDQPAEPVNPQHQIAMELYNQDDFDIAAAVETGELYLQ